MPTMSPRPKAFYTSVCWSLFLAGRVYLLFLSLCLELFPSEGLNSSELYIFSLQQLLPLDTLQIESVIIIDSCAGGRKPSHLKILLEEILTWFQTHSLSSLWGGWLILHVSYPPPFISVYFSPTLASWPRQDGEGQGRRQHGNQECLPHLQIKDGGFTCPHDRFDTAMSKCSKYTCVLWPQVRTACNLELCWDF